MLEKDIERWLCRTIKERGGLTRKFLSTESGMPDRIIIIPGGAVWFVELKSDKGRLTKIQGYQISELEKRGANVKVIYGMDAAKRFVEEVLPNG
jgi:hypothetical protein